VYKGSYNRCVKKLIKNSQPFGMGKMSENRRGGFFDSHCIALNKSKTRTQKQLSFFVNTTERWKFLCRCFIEALLRRCWTWRRHIGFIVEREAHSGCTHCRRATAWKTGPHKSRCQTSRKNHDPDWCRKRRSVQKQLINASRPLMKLQATGSPSEKKISPGK